MSPVRRHWLRRRLRIAASVIACAGGATLTDGCESVIPRRDLQLLAKSLPPSPPIPDEQRDLIAQRIRERSGVSAFEFSDSEFTPETRLPPGTEWIMGVFLGD